MLTVSRMSTSSFLTGDHSQRGGCILLHPGGDHSHAQVPLVTSRHVTSRHVTTRCRAHAFWYRKKSLRAVSQVLCSALDTARRVRQARHDERDRRDTQHLLCNVYEVMITVICLLFNLKFSLIY